jgi:apolipoprotein N-acyltransferase
MKKSIRIVLAITSGIILSAGWYEWGSGLLLLIGFIPLLLIEDDITNQGSIRKNTAIYFYASLSILIWNIITTWWIKNASLAGLLAAVFVSTFFMAMPVMIYSIVKRNWGRTIGYTSFIICWLAFEFAYNHGEISWPWLSLGNGFMFSTRFIQWYEYTGIFGGSLWVLLINVLSYELIRRLIQGNKIKDEIKLIAAICMVFILPIIISLCRYYTYTEKTNPREIVVVQPNIDPYLKFNDLPPIEQTRIQLSLARKFVTSQTDYIVCPETSIMNNIWIGEFELVPDLRMVKEFVQKNPGVKYVTGIMCRQRYTPWNKTRTASPLGNTGYYYDTFNSAIQYDTTSNVPIYHKSKLVIGVEKMPYPEYLKFLRKLTIHLGGTFRSLGTQKEREVFTSSEDGIGIAPVICYESVYGEYVGDYIKLGANFIFVITNDGWWGNTPGHRQHNALSTLRAIETRRSVARSANTGISCFINQKGDIISWLPFWERGALNGKLNANDRLTFYVKHGDYIGRISFYTSILLLSVIILAALVRKLKNR